MNARREFIKAASAAGVVTASTLIPDVTLNAQQTGQAMLGKVTEHLLPPLPYPYDALEPFIDKETMTIHHDKHHDAYVKGLNKAEQELAKARAANDFALVQHWERQAAFHGGGHFLHTMFWNVMAPNGKGGGGEPTGMLAEKLKEDFGTVEAFKAQFSAAAVAVEGSGWALLHYRAADKRLIILQAENQQKLSAWGIVPILGIDVWEHAYYLKYQNKRADYVKAWWNVVSWAAVENNLKLAMR
jgi:Fe-Mn family superoxide dismutase